MVAFLVGFILVIAVVLGLALFVQAIVKAPKDAISEEEGDE